jgi:hypothetical protein
MRWQYSLRSFCAKREADESANSFFIECLGAFELKSRGG